MSPDADPLAYASQQRFPSITYCVSSPTLRLSMPSFSRVRPRRQ